MQASSWIANYDQLMAMPEARRKAYLQDVRQIVAEFEFNTEVSIATPMGKKSASIWDMMLPDANAGGYEDMLANEGQLNCGDDQLTEIGGHVYCVSRESFSSTGSGKCGSGYVQLSQAANLDPASRKFYQQMCFKPQSGKLENYNPLDDGTPPQVKTLPYYTKDGKEQAEGQTLPYYTKRYPTTEKSAEPGNTAGPGNTVDPKKGDYLNDPNPPTTQEAPNSGSKDCQAMIPKCTKNREEARRDFFSKRRPCIFGGNISEYRSAQPKRGDCKPVAKVEISDGKTFACKSGSVCNPLVFCAKNLDKKEPYCAHGMEATRSCQDQALKGQAGGDCLNKLLGSADFRARDAWNKYIKDIKKVCTDDHESAQFHCVECGIIYARIFAVNSKFYGDLCKANPSTAPVDQKSGQPSQPPSSPHSDSTTTSI